MDSYEFGVIVINGKKYQSDIIVFPEKVIENWWRKEGHRLCPEDLQEVFRHEPKPKVLIVGTGYYGFIKVSLDAKGALQSQGIELTAQPTKEACQTFNMLLKSNKRVAGAFHLSC
ncbi:MAG: Mth938-like domain-containing protein [Candidatus Bathycorpusculaceae bacterium]